MDTGPSATTKKAEKATRQPRKVRALVGMNVGDERFEPGETITASLPEASRARYLRRGWIEEVKR